MLHAAGLLGADYAAVHWRRRDKCNSNTACYARSPNCGGPDELVANVTSLLAAAAAAENNSSAAATQSTRAQRARQERARAAASPATAALPPAALPVVVATNEMGLPELARLRALGLLVLRNTTLSYLSLLRALDVAVLDVMVSE